MSRLKAHPYASFLHEVEKPARYIGGEYNQIVKDPRSVRVQLALAFPDLYDIGMSHLGTKILYSLVNKREDMLCERAFAPWPDMEAQLRTHGLPVLSLETHRSLAEFDALGFSLQYELTFTNLLNILDLCGIPLHGEDRNESHPLILAGGPVATQPEAMAPFVDVFLIGDAEEKLPELLIQLADCKEEGLSRQDTLLALAKLDGLYCPALYETAVVDRGGFEVVTAPRHADVPAAPRRCIVDDLDRYPFPDDSPVAAAEAIFDRMSVEIARGCTEGCRFCQAGMIYRPVRERDPEQIVDTLISALEKGGYDEAGLTTLSTADYSCISPLIKRVMEKLRPEKVSLSIASLRAYGLDEELLDEISSVRATGLTFAPEAGTQRMRDVVNKNISEEDITRTAHRVFSRGWNRMKLYFMIGLPSEEDEDVAGIMELGHKMKEIGRGYHRAKAGVTVAV
ncbi:MAG TPA: TIGR03960 family B12-binding radical SAM protein, partial [Candidatus Krumholzibacteria bacterium]|nr:TIGR03960 family B12-binding radical SAM protein [Candidatus Krumholzibacteria bacterium]